MCSNWLGGGEGAVAAKIKLMELAKELGVTSKELMVAAEEMVTRAYAP